jgi:hypothetical protein
MVKIISKAISLANLPMLTEAELLVRARDWSEALWEIVPVEALNQCLRRAFEDHRSTFALNAYDLKSAYEKLKAQRTVIADDRQLTNDERVERCTNKANHLPDTFGEIELCISGIAEGIVPCGRCRGEEFREAKRKLLRGEVEPTIEESIRRGNEYRGRN